MLEAGKRFLGVRREPGNLILSTSSQKKYNHSDSVAITANTKVAHKAGLPALRLFKKSLIASLVASWPTSHLSPIKAEQV